MEVIAIMVGIMVCAFLISKAHIKITITHVYTQPTMSNVGDTISQVDVDKDEDSTKLPTYDDVIAAVHEMLGGNTDAD